MQTELPFLQLGNETRVNGDGKFFKNGYRMLSETENPSFLPFSFGNDKKLIIDVGDIINFYMGSSIMYNFRF